MGKQALALNGQNYLCTVQFSLGDNVLFMPSALPFLSELLLLFLCLLGLLPRLFAPARLDFEGRY